MSADLYGILGVQKGATDAEITKAYRKQALLKHPDRGGSTEEFQRLQKAHEVLANPDSRAFYDRTGKIPGDEPVQQGGPPDLSELFGAMFGGGGMPFFMQGGGGATNNKVRRGPNKHHDIGISLRDLYHGKSFKLCIRRDVICKGCAGRGGAEMKPCEGCRGQGVRVIQMQMGPITTMRQEMCGSCGGKGQTILTKCGECDGRCLKEVGTDIAVVIEPGMGDGDALVFPGLCSESPNIEQAGDLILVIRNTENNTAWIRQGANLVIEVTVSVAESLLGWERTFADHPSGQAIHIVCKRTVREAEQLVIDGKGMPRRGQGQCASFGNLHIVCRVAKLETVLSEEQRSALMTVWPDYLRPVCREGSVVIEPPSAPHT